MAGRCWLWPRRGSNGAGSRCASLVHHAAELRAGQKRRRVARSVVGERQGVLLRGGQHAVEGVLVPGGRASPLGNALAAADVRAFGIGFGVPVPARGAKPRSLRGARGHAGRLAEAGDLLSEPVLRAHPRHGAAPAQVDQVRASTKPVQPGLRSLCKCPAAGVLVIAALDHTLPFAIRQRCPLSGHSDKSSNSHFFVQSRPFREKCFGSRF